MRRIAVALVLLGCSAAPMSRYGAAPSAEIMPDRLYFIDESAPSLPSVRRAIDAAIAGDDAKLAYVISLVRHTDGEAGENYDDMLNELQRAVTRQRFRRVLATLDFTTRQMASACMEVAREL